MPLSSGTFTRIYDWITDRNNAVKIRADRMDEEFDGIADALSLAIYRDGQSTISANIPFNNKKITGLADATNATDALNRQTGDGRYMRNPVDLSNETAIADDDELGFYDTSASANKAITWAAFKTEVAAETAFIPANKVTNTAAGNISATTVQAAIDELDTEKLAKASNLSDVASAATAFANIKQDATTSATGVLRIADQAAMEAATANRAVTADNILYSPRVVKCVGSYTMSGGVPTLDSGSVNVTSITDDNVGDASIVFTTAINNPVVNVTLRNSVANRYTTVTAKSSTGFSVKIQTSTPADTDDYDGLEWVVFGDHS